MGGDTFETIITTMVELGYCVEWQVCNSKHFGVPQNRERVFIVGHFGEPSPGAIFPLTQDDREIIDHRGNEIHRGVVSNTITTRTGEAESVGTYIAERERERERER